MWVLIALTLFSHGSVHAEWVRAYQSAVDCDHLRDGLNAGKGPRDSTVIYICTWTEKVQ